MNTETEGNSDFQKVWEDFAKQPLQFYPSEYKPSRRDYFIAAAIEGICRVSSNNSDSVYTVNGGWLHPETVVKAAIEIADETIKQTITQGDPVTISLTKEHLWNSESGEIGR